MILLMLKYGNFRSQEEKSNFEYSLSAAALSMLVFKMQNITLTL